MPPRRKLAHHRSGRVQTGSSSYPEDPPVSISTVTAWSARSSFQQDFTTLSTTSSKAEFTGSVKACRQRHLSLSGGGAVSCRTVPLKVQPRPNVDRTHFSASARPVQGHSDLPPPGAVSPTAQTLKRQLRTARSTATGAHNHSHAQPQTPWTSCRSSPVVARAGSLHPDGIPRPCSGKAEACHIRAMMWGQLRSLAVTQRRHKRSLTWEHRGRGRP